MMTSVAQTSGFDEDLPLIQAIQRGDAYAFGELVRRHDRWVRGVLFGVLGNSDRLDDVAQQTWTAMWTRIGELREVAKWRPWLYRLARNAAIDAGREQTRRRKHKRESAMRAHSGQTRAGGSGEADSPDNDLTRMETSREVLLAIEALPLLYREPFVLRHLSGWSYREIAEVMNMPVDSVETRLVRARRFLRESLAGRLEALR
ncbi:MAG: RNA polymerase sigma factor [Phycisphaerae bacterium]